MDININNYIKDRVDDQLIYFDNKAKQNQKKYKFTKGIGIVANIFTMMTIALAFTVPDDFKIIMGITALILSTLVLSSYQWEEFQNYGLKWEKFRVVAEELKTEKMLFLYSAGQYHSVDKNDKEKKFVEKVESILKHTDEMYFSMTAEPGKRIEKRITKSIN